MADRRFVAYYRVSTARQGRSGLGLDAQKRAVTDYLNGGAWKLSAEFTEVESGKRSDRPELEKALAACKRHKAKLVIAKLDRLSRNLAFIATLMDSGVEFIAVDNPHANKLTVHCRCCPTRSARSCPLRLRRRAVKRCSGPRRPRLERGPYWRRLRR